MAKMAKTDHLPDEILNEIFSKLPLKSIGKCKCLSKSWNSRLSNPKFITSLLGRTYPQKYLFLITPFNSFHTIPTSFQNDDVLSTKLDLFQDDTWTRVLGCCNGLILLANNKDELCLINPLTTQKANIPEPDFASDKSERVRKHGFGYDTRTNDYKIVMLSYYNPFTVHNSKYTDTYVDVYSVKTRFWKRVGVFPYKGFVPEKATGVFVNGAVHWQAFNWQASGIGFHYPSIIAAFDLADEVFYEIKAPFVRNSLHENLVVREGRLCMVTSYYCPSSDVWTMEEYGVVESWKMLTIAENGVWRIIKPKCFVGEDQVVLTTESMRLVVYDVKEGTMKGLVVDGDPVFCEDACIFVESLVSIG